MKRLATVLALLIFACNIVGCGGGGGGSSTTTVISPETLDTITGKSNNIYITDNNDMPQAISSAMIVSSPDLSTLTNSAPALKSILYGAAPLKASATKTGTYAGHPYSLTATENFYNKTNAIVDPASITPDQLGMYIVSLTGYISNVTINGTITESDIQTSQYSKASKTWIFTCSITESLVIANGSKQFSYSGIFKTNINIVNGVISSTQTGTMTMNFGNGWTITGTNNNEYFSGYIKYGNVVEGTISMSNSACTLVDSETNDSIIINSNGITFNSNVASPFVGTWSGPWEQGQYGTLTLTIDQTGNFTGTIVNQSINATGYLKGFINRSGEFCAAYTYNGSSAGTNIGKLVLSTDKKTAQCDFVAVRNGVRSAAGNSGLTKQ